MGRYYETIDRFAVALAQGVMRFRWLVLLAALLAASLVSWELSLARKKLACNSSSSDLVGMYFLIGSHMLTFAALMMRCS